MNQAEQAPAPKESPIAFSVKEVADKYEALVNKDRTITRLGLYSGKLSGIPIELADLLANEGGCNLLKEKPGNSGAAIAAAAKESGAKAK